MNTTEDRRFSMYIRERDDFTCLSCGKQYPPNSAYLQCAHMFGRWKLSVRTDPDDACALCSDCHHYLDEHPLEKRTFFRTLLGEARFEALELRSNTLGVRP